jgi:hypothetical protein
MRTFFTTAVLIFTCTNFARAFDQLPRELFEKIILMEPAIIGVLSSTCKRTNTLCRAWAAEKDKDFVKNFIADAYINNAPHSILFMLMNNTKYDAKELIEDKKYRWSKESRDCGKILSTFQPWLIQQTIYKTRDYNKPIDNDYIERVVLNSFLVPIYYRHEKATPTMHALMEQRFLNDSTKRTFDALLKSGMNPYCRHNGKDIFDLIKDDEKYDYILAAFSVNKEAEFANLKQEFIELCTPYKREPIDPTVVIYWKKSKTEAVPLTIDDIDKICSSSNQ